MKRSIRAAVVAAAMCAGLTAVSAGEVSAESIGKQGCTPGYWKNHTDGWEEYAPTTPVKQLFTRAQLATLPSGIRAMLNGVTFAQALQGGGGSGVAGAVKILLRATAASYLNAAHEGVAYPYRRFTNPFGIQQKVLAALASGDREEMLDLAAKLDAANNLGCPLN